jgi:predicted ATPase
LFKKMRLKNFRTHLDTSVDLSDVTLFIGSNNAGKTNLFAGIQHFSKLIARARPDHRETLSATPDAADAGSALAASSVVSHMHADMRQCQTHYEHTMRMRLRRTFSRHRTCGHILFIPALNHIAGLIIRRSKIAYNGIRWLLD